MDIQTSGFLCYHAIVFRYSDNLVGILDDIFRYKGTCVLPRIRYAGSGSVEVLL